MSGIQQLMAIMCIALVAGAVAALWLFGKYGQK